MFSHAYFIGLSDLGNKIDSSFLLFGGKNGGKNGNTSLEVRMGI